MEGRRVELDRGCEAGIRRNRRVDGDVDRSQTLLDGEDERRNALEIGEVRWERHSLDPGASQLDSFLERSRASCYECDLIAFTSESCGEEAPSPVPAPKRAIVFLSAIMHSREVVCFADQIIAIDRAAHKKANF